MNALTMYSHVQQSSHDQLVTEHAPLVKRIAYHLLGRLPSSIQLDDLVQAGMIGLLEAIRNYDASRGASFETYARIRIQGAMLDEVRRGNWTPRSVYRKTRLLNEAIREVENREGRDARDHEVAEVLGMEMAEYNSLLRDTSACSVLSFEEVTVAAEEQAEPGFSPAPKPFQEVQQNAFKEGLAEAIAGLPEREQLVMSLYYDEEFNLREIGEILGVSEARVCQIHGKALAQLRVRMKDWIDDDL